MSSEFPHNVSGISPGFRQNIKLEQLKTGDNHNSAFPHATGSSSLATVTARDTDEKARVTGELELVVCVTQHSISLSSIVICSCLPLNIDKEGVDPDSTGISCFSREIV